MLFHCASCYYPDMPREFEFAYPQDFARPGRPGAGHVIEQSNSLRGTDISPAAPADRVWLIDVDGTPQEGMGPLRLRSVFRAGDIRLALYTR
jgi:hypothetical protein